MEEHGALHQDSKKLADEILASVLGGEPVVAILSTDEKIIARITDGIYRQPASALRELISNAYDADSTAVTIDTDYPRFEQITIRDDGIGMGEEVLANLVRHIGGSAKRGSLGMEIGVTNAKDSSKTLSGRNIIGKIGIGLFSVAQLTQQFQIITKVAGKEYRLVADVTLKTYTEDDELEDPGSEKFESGKVVIRKVKAVDINAHGTDIILMNLRKNALAILKSEDVWSKVAGADSEKTKLEYSPSFHIGQYLKGNGGVFSQEHDVCLPWLSDSNVNDRFKNIYDSLLAEFGKTRSTPRLESTFDNYFQMLWSLALSSPISYIHKHPFQLTGNDEPVFFQISNDTKGQVENIDLLSSNYQDLSGALNPLEDPLGGFEVFVDGMKLYRPLAFNEQKKSSNALKDPLMFYGRYRAEFGEAKKSVTGGGLEFEAYFFWNSKILPTDHNGISIRINNASGTLFDSRWLGYPVAEKTTLGQISAEIFVVNGLDAALNIDRESFNYAHPHYQILSKWVHNALRQIVAKQKKLRSERNKAKKSFEKVEAVQNLYESDVAVKLAGILHEMPEISDSKEQVSILRGDGIISFYRKDIFSKSVEDITSERLKLVVAVLESRELLSGLSYAEQEDLVKDIAEILAFGE
jgi:hypothetical protein